MCPFSPPRLLLLLLLLTQLCAVAPAAGSSEAFDGGFCVVRRWRLRLSKRRVWSTGVLEAVGERDADGSKAKSSPLFGRSQRLATYLVSVHRWFQFALFCVRVTLSLADLEELLPTARKACDSLIIRCTLQRCILIDPPPPTLTPHLTPLLPVVASGHMV